MSEEVREVERQGRSYLVFPVIASKEMVLDYPENGTQEYLPRERLSESAQMWAGSSITFVHPDNRRITADEPDAYTGNVIGQAHRPEMVDDKLRVQAWIDIAKANSIGGLAETVVEKLRNGDELAVSAGYATVDDDFTGGTFNGQSYDVEQGHIIPDHIAIFPSDEFNARCDLEDGCGAPRANAVYSPDKSMTNCTPGHCTCGDHTMSANRANADISEGDFVDVGDEYGQVVDTIEAGETYSGVIDDRTPVSGPAALYEVYEYTNDAWDGTGQMDAAELETLSPLAVLPPDGPTTVDRQNMTPRANYREGQYVKWSWSGGTAYGQVAERVTEPGVCRTVEGNERCADEERNVLVITHMSEDGESQNQRVVKFEDQDNLEAWDAPASAYEMTVNAEVNGEDIDLTPTQEMADVAQDFLDAHDEGLIPDSCETSDTSSTGYQRAQQIANREELSPEDIVGAGDGMAGWHARHMAQDNHEVQTEQREDETQREARYRDCGYAAFRSWAGQPGADWAQRMAERIRRMRDNAMSNQTEDDPLAYALGRRILNAITVGSDSKANASAAQTPDLDSLVDETVDEPSPDTSDSVDTEPDTDDVDTSDTESESTTDVVDDEDSTDTDGEAQTETTDTETDTETVDNTDTETDTESATNEPTDTDTETTSEQTMPDVLSIEEMASKSAFGVATLQEWDDTELLALEQTILENNPELEMEDYDDNDEMPEEDEMNDESGGEYRDNAADDENTANADDDRIASLEEKVDQLTEAVNKQNSEQKEEKARAVANSIEGMTAEAVLDLPSERVDALYEEHANTANYGGVPGSVDRTPRQNASDEDVSDMPSGGRSAWEERRAEGGD